MVLHCFYELEWLILCDFVKITFHKIYTNMKIVINASKTFQQIISPNSKCRENPCASFRRVPGPPNPHISLVCFHFYFYVFYICLEKGGLEIKPCYFLGIPQPIVVGILCSSRPCVVVVRVPCIGVGPLYSSVPSAIVGAF